MEYNASGRAPGCGQFEQMRRSGFSLLELLVVVALIAVLAALLAPVYVRSKNNAMTGRCQVQQKELLGALTMYLTDYGDRLPPSGFLTYRSDGRGLYQPYAKNFDILICPTKGSYGYNLNICGSLGNKAWIPGPIASHCDVRRNGDFKGRLFSEIPLPGRTMAFLCAKAMWGSDDRGANGWEWEPHDIGPPYVEERLPNLHADGTNYAFLDGHSRWRKPDSHRFPIATTNIDYDGNGSVGSADTLR